MDDVLLDFSILKLVKAQVVDESEDDEMRRETCEKCLSLNRPGQFPRFFRLRNFVCDINCLVLLG